MQVIRTVKEMQEIVGKLKNKKIGFVPTMGYLHEGHLSLVEKARENDIIIVSIYVNPTQFDNKEDLEKYPRNFERDERLLKDKVDYLFYPDDKEMYSNCMKYVNYDNKFMNGLCGVRVNHFEGVVTIVKKLFDVVKPSKVYFGQKDYQQCLVVNQMIKDFKLDIEFVMCPIIREKDGLAMSSRNERLSDRDKAVVLFKSLMMCKEMINKGEKDCDKIISKVRDKIESVSDSIDYIEIRDAETLDEIDVISGRVVIALAVFFGEVRLIDNVVV